MVRISAIEKLVVGEDTLEESINAKLSDVTLRCPMKETRFKFVARLSTHLLQPEIE
jgi:hypothetical protein